MTKSYAEQWNRKFFWWTKNEVWVREWQGFQWYVSFYWAVTLWVGTQEKWCVVKPNNIIFFVFGFRWCLVGCPNWALSHLSLISELKPYPWGGHEIQNYWSWQNLSQIGPLVQKLWLKNSENLQIYAYRVPGAITRVPGTRISLITRAGTRDPSQA